jgi:hypothetical protein
VTQLLMLDAAFPPDPAGLIADITTVSADGAFLYVWGPFVNGSPAHVRALQAAGLHVAPIVVPGNIPSTLGAMIGAVEAWGFQAGPVFFDFERGSDPGKPWFDAAQAFFSIHGYRAEPYGTLSVLGQYDPDDKDWVANWLRTGILDPIPQLPPDWEAWQFVNDIVINGHQYDASVVSAAIMAGQGELDNMNQGTKVGLAHVAIKSIYQREPTQQELFDFANTLNDDGSNFADLVQGLAGNTQNPDLVNIQNQALQQAVEQVWMHVDNIVGGDVRPALKQALIDAANKL